MADQKSTITVTLKDKVTPKAKSIGSQLGGMVKKIVKSKLAFAAVAATVGIALTSFAQFETKVVNVTNLLGGTAETTKKFTGELLALSQRVPQSVDNLADSLFDVVSAGVSAGDSIAFLETASKLAVAGVTDTKTAVDGLTSAINAYGMDSGDAMAVADMFFAAQVEGKTTIAELGNTIGSVAPIANAAGEAFGDLLGDVTALTKQGIKTDEAVTGVRAAFSSIIKPAKESADMAAKLGIDFSTTAIKSGGLVGVLKEVQRATGGNVEEIAKLFPNIRALNAVIALSKNDFKDLEKAQLAVKDSTEVVDAAVKNQMDTMAAQFTLFKNQVTVLSHEMIGVLAPAITGTMNVVSEFLDLLGGTNREQAEFARNAKDIKGAMEDEATAVGVFAKSLYVLIEQEEALNEKLSNQRKSLFGIETAKQKALKAAIATNQTQQENQQKLIDGIKEEIRVREEKRIADENAAKKAKKDIDDYNQSVIDKQNAETEALRVTFETYTEYFANLKVLRDVSTAEEIAKIEELLNAKVLADEERAKLEEELRAKRTELRLEDEATEEADRQKKKDANEALSKALLTDYEKQLKKTKTLRDVDLKEEIDGLNLLLSESKLTGAEREAVLNKLYAAEEALRKKSLESELSLKQALQALDETFGALQTIAQKTKSKELFAIAKAGAVATAVISTYEGVNKTLSAYPYPANLLPAAAQLATGLANVATISSQNFAEGGIVPGSSYSGDKVQANLNSGEAVLTRQDQSDLLNFIRGNNNNVGGQASQPIVVQVVLNEQILGEQIVDILERERQRIL